MAIFRNLSATSQNDSEFLRRISLILDYYLPTYGNFVVIGDFNLPVENSHLEAIILAYALSRLVVNLIHQFLLL